jgi:hypothetical protein
VNKDLATTFLFAKLSRSINTIPDFKPNFDNVNLVSNVTNLEGKLAMFSGAFLTPNGWLGFPFTITFSTGLRGDQVSSLWQLALAAKVQRVERVWAFMSVIDYLIDTGLLSMRARERHKERISKGGLLTGVAEAIAEYDDFCERAAKDLPYDASLEVLAHLKYGDLAAA